MMIARLALLALLCAAPAAAQSQDDFFNPEVLQRVDLWLNEGDWSRLKANFQENTYFPAEVTWNSVTVGNVGFRSGG
jgi:spore coat protein CotH